MSLHPHTNRDFITESGKIISGYSSCGNFKNAFVVLDWQDDDIIYYAGDKQSAIDGVIAANEWMMKNDPSTYTEGMIEKMKEYYEEKCYFIKMSKK